MYTADRPPAGRCESIVSLTIKVGDYPAGGPCLAMACWVPPRADSFSGCLPENSGGYLEFRYKPRYHHEGHEDHEGKRMNFSFFVFFVLFVVKYAVSGNA